MIVTVESIIFGDKNTKIPHFSPVILELVSENITARELIHRTVRKQIQINLEEKRNEVSVVQAMLNRQFLSNEDIEDQSAKGTIRYPTSEASKDHGLDVDHESKKAIDAFYSNTYKMLVGGVQIEDLDDVILLKHDTTVTFIRLMPLKGG